MIDRQDIESEAARRRHILLYGILDDRDKNLVCGSIRHFNYESSEPILIFIDSQGGDTFREGFICDAIKFSAAPVHCVVEGYACSAAFGIVQACHVRRAWPNARFMFHAPAVGNARVDEDCLSDMVAELRRLHEEQIVLFARRSKRSEEEWRSWAKAEKYFSAQEALEIGMIDEIIQPQSPVK